MTITSKNPPKGWPRIASSAAYENANQAIDWLCKAFGFEVRLKIDGEGGRVEHSELVLGGGMIMVGDNAGAKGRDWYKSPSQVGGANTQAMMVFVDDADAHCARARAAGATIFQEPTTNDYGDDYWTDRTYGAVDIGGHHWWFVQRLREPKPK
jgi:uncharacterized glyoxalase superfamily protein PhnB